MKLIKITDEHYVIVDDSEITQACYVYKNHENVHGRGIFYLPPDTDFVAFNKEAKDLSVITYSTEPCESVKGYNYISLQEVKQLIGEVDVKSKGENYSTTHEDVSDKLGKYLVGACFQDGYYTALEDNKEKKYTEEDMKECVMFILTDLNTHNEIDKPVNFVWTDSFKKHIQSLQPKTSWEVEIVNNKIRLK